MSYQNQQIMEKSEQIKYPKGHFPLHLSTTLVETPKTIPLSLSPDSHHASFDSQPIALHCLEQFISLMKRKYDFSVLDAPVGDATHAEAFISVPFSERENIRIDFNIFASDIEATYGSHLYFHMESAF